MLRGTPQASDVTQSLSHSVGDSVGDETILIVSSDVSFRCERKLDEEMNERTDRPSSGEGTVAFTR